MRLNSFELLFAIVAVYFVVGAAPENVLAQKYPDKPVRMIIPFAPGGGTDVLARFLSTKLSEGLGVGLVIENRGGAGGTLGTEVAARSAPDGYTVLFTSASHSFNASLYSKLSYDSLKDFAPVTLVALVPHLLVVHPSLPVKDVKELVSLARRRPGEVFYGSGGSGSSVHLAAVLFTTTARVEMTHVPYKGTGLGLNDLLGGQIQVIFGGFNQMFPQIKTNRVRGIAVTTAKRSNAVADIPTVGETIPGYEAVQWFAIWGPKAFPKDLVARWNREINRILQLSDVKKIMAGDGVEPAGGSPERFREVLTRDVAKWQQVVKIAGIKTGS